MSAPPASNNDGTSTPVTGSAPAAPPSPGEQLYDRIMQDLGDPFANLANLGAGANGAQNTTAPAAAAPAAPAQPAFGQVLNQLDQHFTAQDLGVTAGAEVVHHGEPRRRRRVRRLTDRRPREEGGVPRTRAELEEMGMTYEGILVLERMGWVVD